MRINYDTAQAHFAAYDTSGAIAEDGQTWTGPIENCDVCSRPMGSETYMIDGPAEITAQSRWGNLCVVCARKTSPVIAWGNAQLYKQQNSQWYLISGGAPPKDEYVF